MNQRLFCLPLLVLLTLAGSASGQSMLDLIPDDAMAGFAIRNLDDLKTKGDKFIKDTEIKVPLRPSQVFTFAFRWLGVQGAVDEKGSAAIVVVSEKVTGVRIGLAGSEPLVIVLPYRDLEKVTASLGFKKGTLKLDKLTRRGDTQRFGKFCYANGKHLILGDHDKAVLSVARCKPVSKALSVAQRKRLGNSDMVLVLGTKAWGKMWEEGISDIRKRIHEHGTEAERKTAREFAAALNEVRFVVGGIRIDGGLGVNLVAVFTKEREAVKKFLTNLRGGDGPSSLSGLPARNAVAAWAAKGDGSKNAVIARVFFQLLLHDTLPDFLRFAAPTDRPMLVGLFSEIWQHLRGSRFALYKTANERKLGLFSAVGILDTEDADKFLKELKQLAKFGDPKGLDLKTESVRDANRAEIAKLVANLGARRFRLRESATAKLLLIGEQALPFLEKALKDKDREVARRAEQIKRTLVQSVEQRRKSLLSKNLTQLIKPRFAFLPKSETIEGVKVRVVGVKLSKHDAVYATKLRQLLGPQWNRVRLVPRGKQVVVLLGSDVKLLAATLKNLKDGKPGLAGSPALKEFARRGDKGRKIELHVSLQAGVSLWKATDLQKPGKIESGASMTSFALTVDPERMQFDVWIPAAEIKVAAKASGR